MRRVRKILFTSRDADGQLVLLRWQRAGGIRREGARRIISLVEIDDRSAGFVRGGNIEIAPGAVRFVAIGLIGKDHKQFFVRHFSRGVQAICFAVDLENNRAGRRLLVDGIEHGLDGDQFRRIVGRECGFDSPSRVNWKSLDAGEIFQCRMFMIAQPNAVSFAALDDRPAQCAERQLGGMILQIIVHDDGSDHAIIEHDVNAGARLKRDEAVVQNKRAGEIRRFIFRKNDRIGGIRAGSIFTILKPKESGEIEPAGGTFKALEALLMPALNFVEILRIGSLARLGRITPTQKRSANDDQQYKKFYTTVHL